MTAVFRPATRVRSVEKFFDPYFVEVVDALNAFDSRFREIHALCNRNPPYGIATRSPISHIIEHDLKHWRRHLLITSVCKVMSSSVGEFS